MRPYDLLRRQKPIRVTNGQIVVLERVLAELSAGSVVIVVRNAAERDAIADLYRKVSEEVEWRRPAGLLGRTPKKEAV